MKKTIQIIESKKEVLSLCLILLLCFLSTSIFLSCNDNNELLEEMGEQELSALENEDQQIKTIISDIEKGNSNYQAKSSDSYFYYRYDDNLVDQLGNEYTWLIKDYGEMSNAPYVKFYGPDHSTTYIQMSRIGTTYWYLKKSLLKAGLYSWRYVDNNKNNMTNSSAKIVNIDSGNDYPYNDGECIPDANYCWDSWNFFKYNCTSWAAWKVNQMWGNNEFLNRTSGVYLGNANRWANSFIDLGYTVNNTAALGSLAHWDADAPAHPTAGHIAFVENVYSDGTILISEYNYYAYQYGTRILSPGDDWYPDNFIHAQFQK